MSTTNVRTDIKSEKANVEVFCKRNQKEAVPSERLSGYKAGSWVVVDVDRYSDDCLFFKGEWKGRSAEYRANACALAWNNGQ